MTGNKFNGITHFLKGKRSFCTLMLVMIFLFTTSIAAYAEQVEAPTAIPSAGTYGAPQNIQLKTETVAASVYYTTDGSDPTTTDTLYIDLIKVATNMTIKAIAVKDGMDNSSVAQFDYQIELFTAGDGSADNPYQVATAEQLNNVRYHLDKHFRQTENIDLSSYNTGEGWHPIGDRDSKFTGTFDGNSMTISNLTINRSTTDYVGLFGVTGDNAQIQNVKLENAAVTGEQYTGALVGCNYGTIIKSCATGAVTGYNHVGGLVGYNYRAITNSYASGAVAGAGGVGGLVGYNFYSAITDSYARVAVTGDNASVGGLVGYNNSSTITTSYAVGAVTGTGFRGGLVGYNDKSTVTDSYWDKDTSGMNSSAGGEGKTTAEMKLRQTYANWDFTGIWSIESNKNKGYPFLRGNPPSPDADAVDAAIDALTWEIIKGGNSAPDNVTTDLTKPLPTTEANGTSISWSADPVNWINTTTGEVTLPASGEGHQTVTLTAALSKGNASGIKNFILTIIDPSIVLAPDASLASGIYGGTQNIALFTVTEGATIYYTTDTSDPATSNTRIQYTGAIEVTANMIIKAIALKGGMENSPVSTFEYVIFADGDGSKANPYQVATPEQLDNIRKCPNKYFKQAADIELSSYAAGEGWEPIGNTTSFFEGTFDGNGKTISNLTIKRKTDYIGLFGITGTTAKIENVKLENTKVTGRQCTGALAGKNLGTITNSCVMGAVTGVIHVGGLAGLNESAISGSYANATVDSIIAYGFQNAKHQVGGLVGWNKGTITNSYAGGAVAGDYYVGGLVGWNDSGTITNAYAAVAVTGRDHVGGLVGAEGTVSQSYWDTDTSGTNSSAGGAGKTTAEMKLQGTYVNWDFPGIWSIDTNKNKGYPFLTGNPTNPDADAIDAVIDALTWEIIKGGNSAPDNITTNLNPLLATGANGTTISWSADPVNWIDTATGGVTRPSGQGHQTVTLTATVSKGKISGIKNFILTIIDPIIFAGGNGSEAEPYQVATPEQLNNVRKYLNKHFIQTADINLSSYNADGGWAPIGNHFSSFNGTFNGNGKTISNLTIKRSTKDYVGLFGFTGTNAQIQNVKLENTNVTGKQCTGALVGENQGTITNSYATGAVTGTGTYVGGLVGLNKKAISGTCTIGTVNGQQCTGGLVGDNYGGTITLSYSISTITGRGGVAGLAGSNSGTITNSYARGAATGTQDHIGGLVGWNDGGIISNAYATGAIAVNIVEGPGTHVGGLVGEKGTATKSYWDTTTSGTDSSAGGTGKITTDMKLQGTYVDWDFTDIWNINGGTNDGYPFLKSNPPVETLISITAPSTITGVANGTAKTAAALGLPAKVTLVTNGGDVQADVTWDVASCSYDSAVTTEQNFIVNGTVTLPAGVVNPNNVPLVTSINVTVNAAVPAATCTLTITAATGGSITTGSSGNYAAGTVIDITATPASGYSFNKWTSTGGGTFANVNNASTTYTMPANHVTIMATFTYNSSGGGSSGGGDSSPTPSGTRVTPSGGTFSQNGVTLTFPAGAVENDIQVQVKEAGLSTGMTLPDNSQLLNRIVDIIKDRSGNFLQSVTITLTFNNAGLNPDEYDIVIYYYDEDTGKWIALDNIRLNLKAGTISGDTNHFTKFAVIATPKTIKEEKPAKPVTPTGNIPTDISGHWAKDSIMQLINGGVVSGYPDRSFKPDKAVTRAEFTVMIVKTLNLETRAGKSFTDTTSHWAKESISTAAAHGIISGYDENTFGPDNLITKEQAAVIVSLAAQLESVTSELNFTDSKAISPWAQPGVAAAFKGGFISGYPDGSFKPQGNTTRAEAAVIIGKLL